MYNLPGHEMSLQYASLLYQEGNYRYTSPFLPHISVGETWSPDVAGYIVKELIYNPCLRQLNYFHNSYTFLPRHQIKHIIEMQRTGRVEAQGIRRVLQDSPQMSDSTWALC